mmetsp:Transcript_13163/g.27621  ORF Transcript_13163/g.27621 Transcript_13163/m.27621 type:complete len:231 (-) Transcript_13163:313-1005(-)
MSVNLEVAQKAFVHQIFDRITTSDNIVSKDSTSENDISKNIKLVSLDFDRTKLHEILRKHQESGALTNFFEKIALPPLTPCGNQPATSEDDGCAPNEPYPAPNFIAKAHLTMAFAGEEKSSETLIANFRHLQGLEVSMTVTGFLWSSTNAAFAIEVSSSALGDDSISIPPCENAFVHATVWCAPDASSYLSNQLPALVESGKAYRVEFANREILVGKISFWNHNNEPIQV